MFSYHVIRDGEVTLSTWNQSEAFAELQVGDELYRTEKTCETEGSLDEVLDAARDAISKIL